MVIRKVTRHCTDFPGHVVSVIFFLILGGRRNCVTLQHVLSFTTGAEEEPVLGFQLHPTLQFVQATTSFIPTGNTCTNCLYLPCPSADVELPQTDQLFHFYDLAFCNAFLELFELLKYFHNLCPLSGIPTGLPPQVQHSNNINRAHCKAWESLY